jgi:hypothetical protein
MAIFAIKDFSRFSASFSQEAIFVSPNTITIWYGITTKVSYYALFFRNLKFVFDMAAMYPSPSSSPRHGGGLAMPFLIVRELQREWNNVE